MRSFFSVKKFRYTDAVYYIYNSMGFFGIKTKKYCVTVICAANLINHLFCLFLSVDIRLRIL